VHSKLLLITAKSGTKSKYYAGISTGNFHEGNAGVYTDMTLLTANKKITGEVFKVFDYFENTFKYYNYNHLLVSPQFMRNKLVNLIDNEIKFASEGKEAYIILKINNLVDTAMIHKLYQASQNGVKIKLVVRGICALIPGVKGLSENIEAIAIVDKFLEHARVFIFCNNNNEKYYISSADWMTRNLDNRIEVATPIYDPSIQRELRDVIDFQLNDNVKARVVDQFQANVYKKDLADTSHHSQLEIYNYYKALEDKNIQQ
jgi:polyphosphate kinase